MAEGPEEKDHMTIRVFGGSFPEKHFRVRTSTPMERLIRTYSEIVEMPIGRLVFSFLGQKLMDADTPAGLNMPHMGIVGVQVIPEQNETMGSQEEKGQEGNVIEEKVQEEVLTDYELNIPNIGIVETQVIPAQNEAMGNQEGKDQEENGVEEKDQEGEDQKEALEDYGMDENPDNEYIVNKPLKRCWEDEEETTIKKKQ